MRLHLRLRPAPSPALDLHPLRRAEAAAVSRTLRHPTVVADRLERQGRGECLYLVAWDGWRPLGQALLHWHRPQAVAVAGELDTLPYLEDLFVLPGERRRGVGTALLMAAAEAAASRGHPGHTLAVSLRNGEARRLYDRLGYIEAGIPPRHQPTAEHQPGGAVQSYDETVIDLVRWGTFSEAG